MPITDHYIINENPFVLYNKTKAHCKGMMLKFFVGFMITYFVVNWIPEFLGMVFTTSYVDVIAQFRPIEESLREQLPSTPVVMYLFAFLFNGVFSLGEALYTLTFIRNKKIEYKALFEGFAFYLKALGLFVMKTLIVSMWTMLFVFPGIIAMLNFSQAFYILADNPEKSIFQVLAESKIRMFGNRMTFFRYFLIYVPFLFISYIPVAFVGWTSFVDTTTTLGTLLLMVLEVPMYCALGYFEAGKGAFYELLINEGFENFKYAGQEAFRDTSFNDQDVN